MVEWFLQYKYRLRYLPIVLRPITFRILSLFYGFRWSKPSIVPNERYSDQRNVKFNGKNCSNQEQVVHHISIHPSMTNVEYVKLYFVNIKTVHTNFTDQENSWWNLLQNMSPKTIRNSVWYHPYNLNIEFKSSWSIQMPLKIHSRFLRGRFEWKLLFTTSTSHIRVQWRCFR